MMNLKSYIAWNDNHSDKKILVYAHNMKEAKKIAYTWLKKYTPLRIKIKYIPSLDIAEGSPRIEDNIQTLKMVKVFLTQNDDDTLFIIEICRGGIWEVVYTSRSIISINLEVESILNSDFAISTAFDRLHLQDIATGIRLLRRELIHTLMRHVPIPKPSNNMWIASKDGYGTSYKCKICGHHEFYQDGIPFPCSHTPAQWEINLKEKDN